MTSLYKHNTGGIRTKSILHVSSGIYNPTHLKIALHMFGMTRYNSSYHVLQNQIKTSAAC